ncbi:uncharacterized protein MONOS_18619 [Monocercomonoides exilis]|uniref:uncharacterized protein n=1 Tax=Monocercomonoides exilis TaxID=2049356 RepID=UPI003559A293|nr:hypothetical protein MONOS_18619 [Monocercomonoides exilis]
MSDALNKEIQDEKIQVDDLSEDSLKRSENCHSKDIQRQNEMEIVEDNQGNYNDFSEDSQKSVFFFRPASIPESIKTKNQKKDIAIAIVLLILGIICVSIGISFLANGWIWGLVIFGFGILLIIPGIYKTFIICKRRKDDEDDLFDLKE